MASDVFKEVEEELRRDRAAQLWKKYGSYVLGAAVVLVAATAGFVAWRDYENRLGAQRSERLFAAIEVARTDPAKAAADFAGLSAESSGGFSALAGMYQAAAQKQAGQQGAAVATYMAIATQPQSRELGQASLILAAFLQIPSLAPADLERSLADIRANSGAWRPSASEILALSALRLGDDAKARELYTQVADDPNAPPGMRSRAAEMLAAISP